MPDYLNIAGRVRTTAADGVVAEAQEVKDLLKNKSQQELNNDFSTAIEAILLLIPSAASSLNQLADKAFVNSSIATASATFRGTYNLVSDLNLTVSATHAQIGAALAGAISDEDNNDYAFVQVPTSDDTPTQIAKTERYKFNGTAWEYEYDLNNSDYTADQWAAINSGITAALVSKLSALPTNADLTTALGVLTDGIAAINAKIPSAASSSNKLVDTAAMQSYITQVLDTIDATFNVTSTDGHVTVQITQVNGVITNVAVTTSDIASAADLSLLAGRVTTAEGNISTNTEDIAELQDLYNALQQSEPVIIEPTDTWPVTNPSTKTIYRVVDRVNTPPQYYSDYMWNGTTMVLMAQYNNAIDPRPKKGSQNLVTSGGVFDNMGALDVSELNATENPHTLATYVDLSAAIAAIPSDYQKGGMSAKFVLSSDNKYVQWFLTKDEWSSSESDWEKLNLEEEVSQLDQKLIKLVGIALAWADIKPLSEWQIGDVWMCTDPSHNKLRKCTAIREKAPVFEYVPFIDGAIYTYDSELYVWNGESLVKDNQNIENSIKVVDYKTLKLTALYGLPSTPEVGKYYLSSGGELRKITSVSGTSIKGYDVIPFEDGAIYTYNNRTYVWDGTNMVWSFNAADKSTGQSIETSPSSDLLKTQLNGSVLTILETWELGFIRTNGDTINPSATEQPTGWRHLLIPCVEGDAFTISGEGADGARLWCFANSNNVPLDRASGAISADYLTIVAPANTSYLVINDKKTGKTCYKGKSYASLLDERFGNEPRVIILKAYKAIPSYPYGLQVGDYYWAGDYLYYVTSVRSDGFPSGRAAITPRDTDIYIYRDALYVWNGSDIVRKTDTQDPYKVRMTGVVLEEGSPASERVIYPVLWGVKYDNSKNVMNGYGKRSHSIPVGWLYYDKENPSDIYYSHGVADRLKKIFTWNDTVSNGYSPMYYHPMICRNGDIVCVPYADKYPSSSSPATRTANPIIYKHGDYDNPVEINVNEATYGIKPLAWFANNAASFVYQDNSNDIDCFVFGEYVRPNFEPANVWKVTYPFDEPSNWKVVIHTTGTGEGTREVEHFHSVNFDPFTGALYAASGDSANESKIWESKDNGETWSLVYDAGGDETKRTFARMLNWIFTEDGAYYGSDQAGVVNRISRGENNNFSSDTAYNYLDFNTIARIGVLVAKGDNITVGQTYFTCLVDEPFGLLFLQQRGNTDGKNNAVFYLPLNRKLELGDIVSWNYYDGENVVTKIGTIDTLTSETSGTIYLGLGVRATFGKSQSTDATHVNTSRLYPYRDNPKYRINEVFIMESINGISAPNGFRCDAVNVYQSRAEKRFVCGFGVDWNYNEMAGNKSQSAIDICNLALDVQ